MEEMQSRTPLGELEARWERLQVRMRQESVDGALVIQNADRFYFSGTIQQGQLYIPAHGKPLLMVRKDFDRARQESAVPRIEAFSSPRQLPSILRQHGIPLPETLGLELDVLPAGQYLSLAGLLEKTRIVDLSQAIRMVRAVKSDYEIERIRKAAEFSDRLAAAVPSILREGMPEIELAGRIEAEARKWGHQGLVRMRLFGGEMFYGHVMAGKTAARPSYLASPTGGAGVNPAMSQGASLRPIGRNEPVLVDLVFTLEGYLSDHTRIFSIGELPGELVEAHNAMITVEHAVQEAARPGVKAGDLYELAFSIADAHGLGDYFMGTGEQRIRFVGHGIGLELDEYPFLARGQELVLEAGMVIALEPKVVLPEKGVMGVENTHVVTESGLWQLGRFQESIVVL
jgi:Xaa-Pro aminopeptidase